MRILYLHATIVPPSTDPRRNRFSLLKGAVGGDILHPVWHRSPAEVISQYGKDSYPTYTADGFRYHWLLASCYNWRWKLRCAAFYILRGWKLHRERPFDCIVIYGHMLTGLCGVVLKILTGAKLVVEIATSPDRVFLTEHPHPTLRDRLQRLYSDVSLHISLWSADRAHLLAAGLLDSYRWLRSVPASVFHEFVPVSLISRRPSGPETYVLLVGAPWYLKGADLLIDAFLRLSPDFPDVTLKILGYFPDRQNLQALAAGSPRIEILKPRPNEETLEIIAGAAVFALPSRCEGMGRVILEAMAAAVPVVASHVGGIPSLVRDGENGFLVPAEDSAALEARLRLLLADPALRTRMGTCGYEMAHTRFTEDVYVKQFTRMIHDAAPEKRESSRAGAVV